MRAKAGAVSVAGLPKSGNRLVAYTLWEHYGMEHRIWVCPYGKPDEYRHLREVAAQNGSDLRVILMLRDFDCNAASQYQPDRQYAISEDIRECHALHWRPTLEAAAGCGLLSVRYEDLIASPDEWGARIVDFLGCGPWRGWQQEIYDGNAKYREEDVSSRLTSVTGA